MREIQLENSEKEIFDANGETLINVRRHTEKFRLKDNPNSSQTREDEDQMNLEPASSSNS